ncbi:DUF2931 family protein [Marinobacter sp. M3C]|jgi:hypothetical protein|uniref:DUF2931 family protein n=1 Tax=Marinobacter sp. M3C TaxID=2917715 RepID=UPI0020107041|nr:DUF2931 family protein [Marinobacter sp. M3C]MCL1478620.1 DUF2931 family protein [Marinobacter sp.]MCL1482045.1 DUF2931 family protein [Marinobacter sp.]MCL1485841.1 DUF2931 family protein [Marinobacter sp.]MCL1487896.1 DUF2931 family protein [Marinobacter sp.]UQG58834.1 DUF2931 family protein [Marinobacter sp. M3C]
MMRRLVVLVTVICTSLLLSGCSFAGKPEWDKQVKYRLKVSVPRHYDAWVKRLQFEATGERAWWWPVGITNCCWKDLGSDGSELEPMPDYIYISWFSLAEQQSYARLIHIPDPEALRERMEQLAPVHKIGKLYNLPRYNLVLGLAPGGTVVMWIMSKAETAIEVGRYKAVKIDTHPEYYEKRTERYLSDHGDYLKEHGLQLDRW